MAIVENDRVLTQQEEDRLVSVVEFAAEINVPESTIRGWFARNSIEPVTYRLNAHGKRTPYYSLLKSRELSRLYGISTKERFKAGTAFIQAMLSEKGRAQLSLFIEQKRLDFGDLSLEQVITRLENDEIARALAINYINLDEQNNWLLSQYEDTAQKLLTYEQQEDNIAVGYDTNYEEIYTLSERVKDLEQQVLDLEYERDNWRKLAHKRARKIRALQEEANK